MKNSCIVLGLVMVVSLAGCRREPEPAPPINAEPAVGVNRNAVDAGGGEYDADLTMEAARERMQEINERLNEAVRDAADRAEDAGRRAQLEMRQRQVQARLNDLGDATEEEWQRLQDGTRDLIEDAEEWFEEQRD